MGFRTEKEINEGKKIPIREDGRPVSWFTKEDLDYVSDRDD